VWKPQGSGCMLWVQGSGCGLKVGVWVEGSGFRVRAQGSRCGLRAQGSGCGFTAPTDTSGAAPLPVLACFGFRIYGSGFRDEVLRFGVRGSGSRV